MANLRSTPRYQFLLALQFLMLVQSTVWCYQYKVGDLDAWGLPTSANPQVYTKWSKYHSFKIGDSLCKFPFSPLCFLIPNQHNTDTKSLISYSYVCSVLVPTKPRLSDSSHGAILQGLQPQRSNLVHEQWQLFV